MCNKTLEVSRNPDIKEVIVTGANGFIGSEVVRQLSSQGVFVYAVVKDRNVNLASIGQLNNVKIIYCPLDNLRTLPKQISSTNIDIFYHFAWAGIAGMARGDYDLQMGNVKWTGDAVEAAALLGCKKFIFASSIMEYELEKVMQAEKTPAIGHIYSIAKKAATSLGMTLAGAKGIEYIPAIISNVYGAGEISERLVNSTIRKLLNQEETRFSSCEQMYDFIYITDAGRAFVELGKNGNKNRKYYIGSGKPQKLRSYIEVLRDIVDPTQELGFSKLGGTSEIISLEYNEFDMNSIYEDTGFIPKVSFEDGIKKTLDWLLWNGEKNG